MDAHISAAHRAHPSHTQDLPSSRSAAEAPEVLGEKAYTKPTVELSGSVAEITAGSNIFGD